MRSTTTGSWVVLVFLCSILGKKLSWYSYLEAVPLGRRYVLSLLCTEVALIVSHPHGVNARKNICFLMLEKNTGSLLSVCIAGGAPALGNSFWCGFWRIWNSDLRYSECWELCAAGVGRSVSKTLGAVPFLLFSIYPLYKRNPNLVK